MPPGEVAQPVGPKQLPNRVTSWVGSEGRPRKAIPEIGEVGLLTGEGPLLRETSRVQGTLQRLRLTSDLVLELF